MDLPRRLQVGMRMTMMNGITLTGYTYSEVLELLSRMARPVRIKFADVSKGIVVRVAVSIVVKTASNVALILLLFSFLT